MSLFQYSQPGAAISLPELSDSLGLQKSSFTFLGAQAGGMGVCIHVSHDQTKTEYALKSIRLELLGDSSAQDRFADELKVWLAVSSCTLVVEALAVLRLDGAISIASTWMAGGSLAANLPRMPIDQKLETLLRTVRALRLVHEKFNVIHRDIKPANILLDGQGCAYLADWGLARPTRAIMYQATHSSGDFERIDKSSAGSFVGTLLYAAPEQIRGLEIVDYRADIYALGCVMFEMEVGHPPFFAKSPAELAAMHLNARPPSLGGLISRGELGLSKLISACLAKVPQERPQTYAELEADLLRAMSRYGGDPARCAIGVRYQRPIVGQGHVEQTVLIDRAIALGDNGMGVVEFDDFLKQNEEAAALAVLGHFSRAAEMLEPYIIHSQLQALPQWCFCHTAALNYAYYLSQTSDKLDQGLTVFGWLSNTQDKPTNFYVNYSFALLRASRSAEAVVVCEQGLDRFPSDLALSGNRTIGLGHVGRLDEALKSAFHRVEMRRDAHSLEEAGVICLRIAEQERDGNLPKSIAAAKDAGLFLSEGLHLRRDGLALWLNAIRLRRFSNEPEEAAKICQLIYNNDIFDRLTREMAICEILRILGTFEDLTAFDEHHERFKNLGQTVFFRKTFDRIKSSVSVDRLFRSIVGLQGPISKEGFDAIQSCLVKTNSEYEEPVDAARALALAGRVPESLDLLERLYGCKPTLWSAASTMAVCFLKLDNVMARRKADYLVQKFAWRAEAYDTASLIYTKIGDIKQANEIKQKGDKVFDHEMNFFEGLQKYLISLVWPLLSK